MDFYSFSALREWRNIDILLISAEEKTVIAIENKVGAHEHSNQLNRDREILEKDLKPEFEKTDKLFSDLIDAKEKLLNAYDDLIGYVKKYGTKEGFALLS